MPGKVPSALEIFLNYNSFNNTSNYIPAPSSSMQITLMKTLWEDCTGTGTPAKNYNICGRIKDVTALIQANYNNYMNVYQTDNEKWKGTGTDDWGCTTAPVTLNEQLILAHLYGWGPFNADSGCKANVNLLEQTPGYTDPTKAPHYYADVKAEYDQLQYWFNVSTASMANGRIRQSLTMGNSTLMWRSSTAEALYERAVYLRLFGR